MNDVNEYSATTGQTTSHKEVATNHSSGKSVQRQKEEAMSKQFGNFLSSGGEIIKKGFAFVGKQIGEGIRSSKFAIKYSDI